MAWISLGVSSASTLGHYIPKQLFQVKDIVGCGPEAVVTHHVNGQGLCCHVDCDRAKTVEVVKTLSLGNSDHITVTRCFI